MEDVSSPDFEKIVAAAAAEAPPAPFKRSRGRPKKQETLEREAEANYDPLTDRRKDSRRQIIALAIEDPDEQLKALEDAMTPRQLAFCREYIIDFNALAACLRAGYSEKSAKYISYDLMKLRAIRRLIELYTAKEPNSLRQIDKDYVIQKVTEIIQTASKDSDKLRGLELIAKHLGMFVERTEITGRDGEAIRIEETKKEADDVARRLRAIASRPTLRAVGDDD
jgi:phage terminase small subunit